MVKLLTAPTLAGAEQASYAVETGDIFSGVNHPLRDCDLLPASSAEGKTHWTCFYTSRMPLWYVQEKLFALSYRLC